MRSYQLEGLSYDDLGGGIPELLKAFGAKPGSSGEMLTGLVVSECGYCGLLGISGTFGLGGVLGMIPPGRTIFAVGGGGNPVRCGWSCGDMIFRFVPC